MRYLAAILSVLFLLYGNELKAEAQLAGNVTSINYDSGFNAMRNPALMAWQLNSSVSFAYVHSKLAGSSMDMNIDFSGVNYTYNASFRENFNGAAVFSDVIRSGSSSYGIGIGRTGDGQFVKSESEYSGLGSFSDETKTYTGSAIYLSYAYRVNNRESFGIQIDIDASHEYIDKNSNDGTNYTHLISEKNRVTSGVAFGYSQVGDHYNFGAVLKLGKYGFENLNYDLEYNGIKSNKKISSYFLTHESASALLGFGFIPLHRLTISIEAGGVVPYIKKEKSCNDSLVQSTEITGVKYTLLVRGGFSYRLTKNIELGFGGAYIKYSDESNDSSHTFRGESDFTVYQAGSGIDIRLSDSLNIIAGLGYNRVMMESKAVYTLYAFDMKINQNKVEATIGASLKY